MKKFMPAKVLSCEGYPYSYCGSDYYLLKLLVVDDMPEIKPGQFITIAPLHPSSQMPRPFTVYDFRKVELGMEIHIIFEAKGKNTNLMANLQQGQWVRVSGPIGKPINIRVDAKKFILVGGGIGIPALALLAKVLHEQGKEVTILLGAKRNELLQLAGEMERYASKIQTITDDVGFVTDLLEKELHPFPTIDTMVIACGPKPMLKKTAELTYICGLSCIVIMEEIMACGEGSCKGCAVFGKHAGQEVVKYLCKDGPAFSAEWVDWDKFSDPKEYIHADQIDPNPLSVVLPGCGSALFLDKCIMNSSGCLDADALEARPELLENLGAFVTKGIMLAPRMGNNTPRVAETPSGMLNSIGLAYVGVKAFIETELPRLLRFNLPIIANISGQSQEEYFELARILVEQDITGLELNISCPNIKSGGVAFGQDPDIAFDITEKVAGYCHSWHKYLIVKLTPNVTNIVDIAKAVQSAGADAVSLINTVRGMGIDVRTRRPKVYSGHAGLSGPAIRPIGVSMVRQIFDANLRMSIIGMGGIDGSEAALEYFLAGATAVAIGTAHFASENIFKDVEEGLLQYMYDQKIDHISRLIGAMEKY